jgi:predicted metal-dependent phosphoesterase TrpH
METLRLKAEFHSHTNYDRQDRIPYSASELIDQAAAKGYAVLAITCHDGLQWAASIQDYAQSQGVLLIPGIEVTIEGKHVLVYGIKHYRRPMSFQDLRALRASHPEVFTIAPHPFYPGRTALGKQLLANIDCFDALEFSHFYSKRINYNQKAVAAARKHNKPLVGTGDVHMFSQLDQTYSILTLAEKSYDGVAEAVRSGRVEVFSTPISIWQMGVITCQLAMMELGGKATALGMMARPNVWDSPLSEK